jgi:hypothetical protein
MNMRKINLSMAIILIVAMNAVAQINLGNIGNDVNNVVKGKGDKSALSNDDIVQGLKEALTIGSNNSAANASKVDGYYKHPVIKLPFPPDAQKVEKTARSAGMGNQVDTFVLKMNRAAEDAGKTVAPIFVDAVKHMTITDGLSILKGNNDAATQYLKTNTSVALKAQFKPIIQASIDRVEVMKYWKPLIDNYNRIPFVTKINPDLNEYICNKALDGLFYLVAQEELKIRKDPMAQVTDILKKVFGQ